MSLKSGTLWIVATPLGNPGDLSPRARAVLADADGVLAEDTRKSGQLLARCGVKARAFTSFHEHNEEARLERALAWLRQGKSLALISDAGTPLLSDPGFPLVRACREEGIAVSPVPGPSALLAALSASGLPPCPFAFLGFAPRKAGDRAAFFAPYARLPVTLVFFERKDRLRAALQSALGELGPRRVCLARELTRPHEEFLYCSLEDTSPLPENLLGEITVIIGPPEADAPLRPGTRIQAGDILREELALGGKAREVARRVAARLARENSGKPLPGWSVKQIYARLQTPADADPGEEA